MDPMGMIFLQQIAEVLPYHLSIYLKYFDVIPGWPDPSINGIKLTTLRFVPHMAWKINGTFRSQVASPETGAWDPSCSQATPGTKPGTGELGIGWGLRKGKNQWESHIPIGSMLLPYMVTFIYHQYTPFMLAYGYDGYGSIPINTIFRGMNIHESQLFWCELQGYKVSTHCHIPAPWIRHGIMISPRPKAHVSQGCNSGRDWRAPSWQDMVDARPGH